MTYYPPYEPAVPRPGLYPPDFGSVTANSPMFNQYGQQGSPGIPSYAITQPEPVAPAAQGLFNQISGNGQSPAGISPAGGVIAEEAPAVTGGVLRNALGSLRAAATHSWANDAPAITGAESAGLLARTPYAVAPLAMSLLGGALQGHTQPGSQPHSIGKGLSTGGTAGGVGLLGSSLLAGGGAIAGTSVLPVTAGAMLGGAAGGYINDRLAQHDVHLGPFHWGTSPHAESQFHDANIDHLIGTASDQFQQGNISKEDFVTIVKQAQLGMAIGGDSNQNKAAIAQQLQQNIVTAAQLQPAREAQAKQDALNHHRELVEQATIAKLMQPMMHDSVASANALAQSVAASRGNLSSSMQPFADLIAHQTQSQAHRQQEAVSQSLLALPQIQSLMQAIQDQNTLQQAANYQAAKTASSSGGNSLSQLLSGAGAGSGVAGPGGASGG